MSEVQKRTWKETFAVYCQRPIFWVFMLGIASGFPLLLTGSTLAARLTETGIDIRTIGVFALSGIPYTFKFLFAPFVDSIRLFRLKDHLAQRKSWCMLSQVLLCASLLAMAWCDPAMHIEWMGVFALLTASFSALQDIVVDALRIELVSKSDQGAASASYVAGYRIGMLLAGAGAFVLASYFPWHTVYIIAAAFMALCALGTLSVRRLKGYEEALENGDLAEDDSKKEKKNEIKSDGGEKVDAKRKSYKTWFFDAVVAPISDFLKRPAAITTLSFIMFFKLGVAMAGTLSTPFYLALDFTKVEIAAVSKVFGVVAVIVGTFIGGLVVKRMPIVKALFFCGVLQLSSNLCYVVLSWVGHSVTALTVSISIENITTGMGSAAFVAFMSQLCNVRFTATQYALLSSLSTVGRTLFSSTAGFFVAYMGWSGYYLFTIVLGIPGLVLLFFVAPALRQKPTNALENESK